MGSIWGSMQNTGCLSLPFHIPSPQGRVNTNVEMPGQAGHDGPKLDALPKNRPLGALHCARRIVYREATADLRRLLPPGTVLLSQVNSSGVLLGESSRHQKAPGRQATYNQRLAAKGVHVQAHPFMRN